MRIASRSERYSVVSGTTLPFSRQVCRPCHSGAALGIGSAPSPSPIDHLTRRSVRHENAKLAVRRRLFCEESDNGFNLSEFRGGFLVRVVRWAGTKGPVCEGSPCFNEHTGWRIATIEGLYCVWLGAMIATSARRWKAHNRRGMSFSCGIFL